MASDAAKAAAKWWADTIRNPGMPDNGDKSEAGGMTAMLAMLTQRPSDPQAVLAFEEALAAKVEDALSSRGSCWLSVDYEPDRNLSDCAEVAGVNPGMGGWPWKTHMDVRPDMVRVAKGYGAEFKIVYPAPA